MKSYAYVILFLFANLILVSGISAQQTLVNGFVKDSATGEPLTGVVIYAMKDSTGTVTDFNGAFSINLKKGAQNLRFDYTGYRRAIVAVNPENAAPVNVLMSPDSKQLNLVVVSSGRYEQKISEVPVSMEVIKPQLIQNKNISNMEAIIDQTPGVNVTDDQANIRGGSGYSYGAGSRVLMVVDDMPMVSGDAGDVKWNYLPIENVSQVEVMKGASSALFGSSALNGVIHFRTAYPTSKPQTNITMYSGFYDEPKRPELKWWPNANPGFSGINFGHSRQIGNFDLVVGGHLYKDDGYRYLETEDRARFNINTRYRFKKVNGLSAGINANGMRTTGGLFILWYNDTLAYIPADSTIQNFENFRYNIDPFIVYHGEKGHNHALRTRLFVTDNNNDTQQGSLAKYYYGEYQYQFRFQNRLSLTAGVVATYTDVQSDLYQDRTSRNMSGYIQFDRKFWDRLFVTFGTRFEYFQMDTASTEYNIYTNKGTESQDTITLPFRPVMRIGATYQITEATFFRASYGQGYRFPCIAEKFIRTSAAGLEIYPNEQLQPEYGQSAEIGIKQGIVLGRFKSYLDVAVFWMEYVDMMEFTFGQYGRPLIDPLFGLGFKSINVGRTRTRGVDISVVGQGQIGKCDFTLLAGYTYMDPQSLVYNDSLDTLKNTAKYNILKYRYKHIAKFDGEITYKKFSFGLSMRYNSFMENIDKFFELALPGIKTYRERFNQGDLVFDTRIMYQINKEVRVSMITNNVFNREYTSRPADVKAPRNFAVQLMVKF
ncbi:MAG: TonB-dependent receptor [Bacteroidia bacterium]|nr:TonB-dependent receptor [Bacteroidia bacterium]